MLPFVVLVAAVFRFGFHFHSIPVMTAYVICGLILVAFSIGRTTLAGTTGLVLTVALLLFAGWSPASWWIVSPAAMGFALLMLDRRSTPIRDRLLWTVPATLFLADRLVPLNEYLGPGSLAASLLLIAPAFVTVLLLPAAPAFAIGTTLVWSLAGTLLLPGHGAHETALTLALLSCGPITMILAGLGKALANAGRW